MMIDLANLVIYCLGWVMLLLIGYVILFKMYYMGERPWWLWPGAIVFLIGDVLINLTIMSILTLDIPRQWTVTERMKRYKASSANRNKGLHWYRYHLADNMCLILNVFDKSKDGHC